MHTRAPMHTGKKNSRRIRAGHGLRGVIALLFGMAAPFVAANSEGNPKETTSSITPGAITCLHPFPPLCFPEDGASGDLTGKLYDLKRDATGAPRAGDRTDAANYWGDWRRIIESGFSAQVFSEFYSVKPTFYLSHLFVRQTPAKEVPRLFCVEEVMDPSGWVAHFTGTLQPEFSGAYRFVGCFTDGMAVVIDGKIVLETERGATGESAGSGLLNWAPAEWLRAHKGPGGEDLVYGDWVEFSSLAPRRIDLLIGEHSGGTSGGILLIQKRGVTYPVTKEGRPILPLFAVNPIRDFDNRWLDTARGTFLLDIRRAPLMNTASRKAAPIRSDEDILIDTGNL